MLTTYFLSIQHVFGSGICWTDINFLHYESCCEGILNYYLQNLNICELNFCFRNSLKKVLELFINKKNFHLSVLKLINCRRFSLYRSSSKKWTLNIFLLLILFNFCYSFCTTLRKKSLKHQFSHDLTSRLIDEEAEKKLIDKYYLLLRNKSLISSVCLFTLTVIVAWGEKLIKDKWSRIKMLSKS